MFDESIAELARRQYGCFNRIQVLRCGGDDSIIRRRTASGHWVVAAPGVYCLRGHPASWMQRVWIAHLEVGLHSKVAFETAARLNHSALFRRDPRIVLAVPHGDHEHHRNYEVRQLTDLAPDHVTRLHGLPVTTPVRTIIDLARFHRYGRMERTLDEALNEGQLTLAELQRLHDELRRPGKRGLRLIGALLADFGEGHVPSDSELNRMLRRIIKRADVPEPVYEASFPWRPKGERRWDVFWSDALLVTEVDGRTYHQRKVTMDEDRRRDREATLHGLTTLRFMWAECAHEALMVVETLEKAHRLGVERQQLRRRASGLWTP